MAGSDPIRQNYTYLVAKMNNIARILGLMFQEQLIDRTTMNRIRGLRGTENQVVALLDAIVRRPDEDFPKFVQILRDTENGFLAERLAPPPPAPSNDPPPPYSEGPARSRSLPYRNPRSTNRHAPRRP